MTDPLSYGEGKVFPQAINDVERYIRKFDDLAKKPQASESKGTRILHDGVAKHVQHVGKTELKFVVFW